MNCKNCGEENSANAKRCKCCNSPLDGTNVISGNQGQKEYIGDNEVLCKNCRRRNPVNALRCLDCNSPLDGSIVIDPRPKKPEIAKAPRSTSPRPEPLSPPQSTNLISCPSCNFANISISTKCSKCGAPLNASAVSSAHKPMKAKGDAPATITTQPIGTGTINPFIQNAKPGQFRLVPLENDIPDESHTIGFAGNNVVLNRSNLEPDNNTISSKGQAEIICNDGKFSIKDKSTFKSTFIRVDEETELKNGDVILMGNKMYVFRND